MCRHVARLYCARCHPDFFTGSAHKCKDFFGVLGEKGDIAFGRLAVAIVRKYMVWVMRIGKGTCVKDESWPG